MPPKVYTRIQNGRPFSYFGIVYTDAAISYNTTINDDISKFDEKKMSAH